MAIFTNQATLTVGGTSIDSNIAYGEILDVLSATKTALEDSYAQGREVSYIITLRNTGTAALSGLSLSDDLGGYDFGGTTLYPLSYVDGSAALFVNGLPQPTPTVTAGPPLLISGLSIPGGGDAVIIYKARVNEFADPTQSGTIVNTVTVSGSGLGSPVTATETVSADTAPELNISKSICPPQVAENERVTYTFFISNSGNTALVETDNAVITDTFDPVLSDLAVSFNGSSWTQGTQYSYDTATGLFTTAAGSLSVPAATYTQDPSTGAYTLSPGISTLAVTGTV